MGSGPSSRVVRRRRPPSCPSAGPAPPAGWARWGRWGRPGSGPPCTPPGSSTFSPSTVTSPPSWCRTADGRASAPPLVVAVLALGAAVGLVLGLSLRPVLERLRRVLLDPPHLLLGLVLLGVPQLFSSAGLFLARASPRRPERPSPRSRPAASLSTEPFIGGLPGSRQSHAERATLPSPEPRFELCHGGPAGRRGARRPERCPSTDTAAVSESSSASSRSARGSGGARTRGGLHRRWAPARQARDGQRGPAHPRRRRDDRAGARQPAPAARAGLVDELVVVDAASADGTAEIASPPVARAVLQESELVTAHGPARGKGRRHVARRVRDHRRHRRIHRHRHRGLRPGVRPRG